MAGLKSSTPEYRVVWNEERARYDVYRGGVRMPYFSHRQGTAIGLAIREAEREANDTGRLITVTSLRGGKRILEWNGP